MITIAVINESTAISDTQVQMMLPAFTTQWNRDLAPIWGLDQAAFTLIPKQGMPLAGAWWLVWLDDADQSDTLAYHDLTDEGLPLCKVFVKTTLADGASLSVAATHEICEMAVDPNINLAAQDDQGRLWAYEVADPVEDDQYAYKISDVLVTNFTLPSWFGPKGAGAPYDFRKHCTDAFQILTRGYAQQFNGSGWKQLSGRGVVKPKALQAPPGSRRARRERGRGAFHRSLPR